VPDDNPDGFVVDSNLSDDDAIGDDQVPPDLADLHALMRPFLRVVVVFYMGFDGRVHRGQIVVHRRLVNETEILFRAMYVLGFPIQSVIPHSQFGYNDGESMAANNTSNYRPSVFSSGNPSEHMRAAAFDINPRVNPMDVTDAHGVRKIDPPGATYDPMALGAITRESTVRRLWTAHRWEWGGNWGDLEANPPTDFFKIGYFDYQHFQLNESRITTLELPPGL
jgi:hypothetical protein